MKFPIAAHILITCASNASAASSSSSPDPRTLAEGGEPAKNFGLGGLNLGGSAWGNDGHDNGGGGFLFDTLKKFADEGYDVEGTCAKMYTKPPECDCQFSQDGGLMSNDLSFWSPDPNDNCPDGTRGWEFKTCLKTSDDIEGTRGKVTLYSPSSCDTQDKIECVIEKFRFSPTYPVTGADFIGFDAAGTVFYDGNDGDSVQTHACQVTLGRKFGVDYLEFNIVGDPFEDLQQPWFYPGGTFPGYYRRFFSNPNDGPLLTSGSGDVVQDMKQCGLPVTG